MTDIDVTEISEDQDQKLELTFTNGAKLTVTFSFEGEFLPLFDDFKETDATEKDIKSYIAANLSREITELF